MQNWARKNGESTYDFSLTQYRGPHKFFRENSFLVLQTQNSWTNTHEKLKNLCDS